MSFRNILPALNLVLVIALAGYIFFKPAPTGRNAYVMNQQVFAQFKGKIELENKLNALRQDYKKQLDSLAASVAFPQQDPAYQQTAREFGLKEQELSDRYTADIWKRINQYIAEYGKQNGYDFIFGASGDGSIMYAGEASNVTEEVIAFINKQYDAN